MDIHEFERRSHEPIDKYWSKETKVKFAAKMRRKKAKAKSRKK